MFFTSINPLTAPQIYLDQLPFETRTLSYTFLK